MQPGDVDLDEVVSLLPAPLFRLRDIYDVAAQLGLHASDAQTLWWILRREGRIVKTAIPVGKGYYWERGVSGADVDREMGRARAGRGDRAHLR